MSVSIVKVQQEDFNLSELEGVLKGGDSGFGAIVTFTGLVRELTEGGLKGLFLEHYPGMTEKALQDIVEQARQRWELGNIIVVHRVGYLALQENIVFVGVSSAHRRNAFEATDFIMDYLKKDAPFWKKEVSESGDHWVEQKASDLSDADRWTS